MIEKQKMTKHAMIDRADRIAFIITTVGVGNIVCTKFWDDVQRYTCLTDTGVIIVKALDGTIITMYFADINQAYSITNGNLTRIMKHIIKKNIEKKYLKLQNGG